MSLDYLIFFQMDLFRAPEFKSVVRVSSVKPAFRKFTKTKSQKDGKRKKGVQDKEKKIKKAGHGHRSQKISLYRRLPIPGTRPQKFVTVKTEDLNRSVDIFYERKMFTIRTADIVKMRTIPDMIRTLQSYKFG